MPTDRIDFTILPENRVIVTKMTRQKTLRRDVPHSKDIKDPDFDLSAALNWCEENGFTVLDWTIGMRAYKGKPWVIRTTYQMNTRRQQLWGELEYLRKKKANPERQAAIMRLLQLDLAYYG